MTKFKFRYILIVLMLVGCLNINCLPQDDEPGLQVARGKQ